ncbi:MAG: hypothetical protein ABUL54_02615 [Dongia sp.]
MLGRIWMLLEPKWIAYFCRSPWTTRNLSVISSLSAIESFGMSEAINSLRVTADCSSSPNASARQ